MQIYKYVIIIHDFKNVNSDRIRNPKKFLSSLLTLKSLTLVNPVVNTWLAKLRFSIYYFKIKS